MKKIPFAALCLMTAALCMVTASCTNNAEDKDFDFSSTLRIDYTSIGDHFGESAEFTAFFRLGEWSGPRRNLVDNADLGDYRVLVVNPEGDTIFLKGFSTLFGEYRTTELARERPEAYPTSVNVPMPRSACTVLIEGRNKTTMEFSPLGRFAFAPGKARKPALAPSDATPIVINGEPRNKIDLTFVAEGYTAGQREKFLSDVGRFTEALFACPPFDSLKSDFNVRAVMTVSDSAGVSYPHLGIVRSTALDSQYNTFGIPRYLMIKNMTGIADAVWDVPTDAIFVLVNEAGYGGGGIYNFYAIGSSDNERTLSVFIHEFGHSFGALADEYFYDGGTAYEDTFYNLQSEPWEPNITTLVDFDAKWKYYRDSLVEGGGYRTKGIYRPAVHCMMRDYAPFCPVCTKSILRNADYVCDRDCSE